DELGHRRGARRPRPAAAPIVVPALSRGRGTGLRHPSPRGALPLLARAHRVHSASVLSERAGGDARRGHHHRDLRVLQPKLRIRRGRHRAADAGLTWRGCVHRNSHLGEQMSASYEAEWRARFGDDAGLPQEVPESAWLRQVLMRRTHRRYAERPVPEPLLRLLLGTAFSASSKSDFQQATVLWVRDRQSRDRLAALVPDMPWVGNAPEFLVFCGDAHRLERIGELRGHINENGKLEGFFNAAIDAALVLQTFILAAETAGLGCCPISALRNHAEEVAAVLCLPDKVFPVAGLCVGYPAAAGHVSMRLPLAVTVHRDRYDDAHLGAAVDAY